MSEHIKKRLDTIAELYLTATDDEYSLLDMHILYANAITGLNYYSGDKDLPVILSNEQKLFFTGVKSYIEDPTDYTLNNMASITVMARNLHDYKVNGTKGTNLQMYGINKDIELSSAFKHTLLIKDKMLLAHLYSALIILAC